MGALQAPAPTVAALAARFEGAGFAPIALPHLYPAETLLELYGEDLRGRAFLFPGAGLGEELALRPDFTIPVVLHHAAQGWQAPGRYSYHGPVFRRQMPGSTRPTEYPQSGIESIGEADAPTRDAEVLGLLLAAVKGVAGTLPISITLGDLGIPFALLDALPIPAPRREKLRRHFWRPARFHRLIAEAQHARPAPDALRAALLATGGNLIAVEQLAARQGEILGTRDVTEIVERARGLAAEAEMAPMPGEEAGLIEAMLGVRADMTTALAMLRDMTEAAGVDLSHALGRFEARLEAIAGLGMAPDEMTFDAAFGRNLEYYDGFVFEIAAIGHEKLPPLAGGGRYDAMTARLGAARPVPAVGGMIRPQVVHAAMAAEEDTR